MLDSLGGILAAVAAPAAAVVTAIGRNARKIVHNARDIRALKAALFGDPDDDADRGDLGELRQEVENIKVEGRRRSNLLTSAAYSLDQVVRALRRADTVDELTLDDVAFRDDFLRGGGGDDDARADGGLILPHSEAESLAEYQARFYHGEGFGAGESADAGDRD